MVVGWDTVETKMHVLVVFTAFVLHYKFFDSAHSKRPLYSLAGYSASSV